MNSSYTIVGIVILFIVGITIVLLMRGSSKDCPTCKTCDVCENTTPIVKECDKCPTCDKCPEHTCPEPNCPICQEYKDCPTCDKCPEHTCPEPNCPTCDKCQECKDCPTCDKCPEHTCPEPNCPTCDKCQECKDCPVCDKCPECKDCPTCPEPNCPTCDKCPEPNCPVCPECNCSAIPCSPVPCSPVPCSPVPCSAVPCSPVPCDTSICNNVCMNKRMENSKTLDKYDKATPLNITIPSNSTFSLAEYNLIKNAFFNPAELLKFPYTFINVKEQTTNSITSLETYLSTLLMYSQIPSYGYSKNNFPEVIMYDNVNKKGYAFNFENNHSDGYLAVGINNSWYDDSMIDYGDLETSNIDSNTIFNTEIYNMDSINMFILNKHNSYVMPAFNQKSTDINTSVDILIKRDNIGRLINTTGFDKYTPYNVVSIDTNKIIKTKDDNITYGYYITLNKN